MVFGYCFGHSGFRRRFRGDLLLSIVWFQRDPERSPCVARVFVQSVLDDDFRVRMEFDEPVDFRFGNAFSRKLELFEIQMHERFD